MKKILNIFCNTIANLHGGLEKLNTGWGYIPLTSSSDQCALGFEMGGSGQHSEMQPATIRLRISDNQPLIYANQAVASPSGPY